jgi:GDP-mannose 6-dehydrogenase
VGCVTAACLAELGYPVVGVDKDEIKVQAVSRGHAPFYEPGLGDVIRSGREQGLLSASAGLEEGLLDADIALICVGTPSERNGDLALGQLRRVCQEITALLPRRSKPLTVAIRSTVFPGVCEQTEHECFAGRSDVSLVCNPEFLREGNAVSDFRNPSLLVVGSRDRAAALRIAGLYEKLAVEPCVVSLRTAEMIKYACNAFHAVKIAFANEIGTLAAYLDVPAEEVMATLCRDRKLNISEAYLRPGFAFGGSCLPKDVRALAFRASRLDLDLPLLESVLTSNERHLRRAIQILLDRPEERIGIFGLAFKENTDDLRESPVVTLVETLLGKGKELRVYDPHIRLDAIYGSNRRFIFSSIPHIERLMENDLNRLLRWASCLAITQKADGPARAAIEAGGIPVIDLTRISTGHAAAPVER